MASRNRKKNPPGFGTAFAFLVGGLALGAVALYSSPVMGKKSKANPCAPYKVNDTTIRKSIETMIDGGDRDPARIAVTVATELFGNHPNGEKVTFPPGPNPPPGVNCVWDRVVALLGLIYDERGLEPDDDAPIEIVPIDPINDLSGYPWETPAVDPNNYPTPGMFLDVGGKKSIDFSKGMYAVSLAMLNSAIAMAAKQGHDVAAVQAIMKLDANKSAAKRELIEQMRELIQCSTWNDGLYGTTKAGQPTYLYGPNDRTLLYLPQHNDNIGLMKQGKSPKRAIGLTGNHLAGQGKRQPQFWGPAINLELLAGPNPIVSVSGMVWSDGVSTIEPPPAVRRLGIDMSGISLPGGPGCPS